MDDKNKWAEDQTKSAESTLRSATVIHLLGQVAFSLAILVWAITVARVLGVEGKGTVSAGLLCASLLGAVGILGTREGISFHVGRYGPGAIRALIPTCLMQSGVVAFLGSGVALAAWASGVAALQDLPLVAVIASGIMAGGVVLVNQLLVILIASGRVLAASSIGIVQMLVATSLFFGIHRAGLSSPASAIWSYAASLLVAAVACAQLISRLGTETSPKWDRRIDGYWRYSLRAFPASLAQFLNFRFDQAVIAATIGPVGLGLYSAAVNVSEVGGYPAASLATIALPAVAKARIPRSLVAVTLLIAMVFSVTILLVLLATGPAVLRGLFGPSFQSGASVLRILVCGAVIYGVARVAGSLAAGLGHPGVATASGLVALALTVPGCIALVPKFGIIAAAWTSAVAYSASCIVALFGLARVLRSVVAAEARQADAVVLHVYSDSNAGDAGITRAALALLHSRGYRVIDGLSTLPGNDSALRERLQFNAPDFARLHSTVWAGLGDTTIAPSLWASSASLARFAAQGIRGVVILLWPRIAGAPIWFGAEVDTIDTVRRAPLVVSKGGGFLYCETLRQLPFLLRMLVPIAVAGAFARPVVLLGQTIGPLKSGIARWIVRKVLLRAGVVVMAREARTVRFLAELGIPSGRVRLGPDTAFGLAATGRITSIAPSRLKVAVSVRPWNFPGYDKTLQMQGCYLDAVAGLIRRLLQTEANVSLVAQVVSDDPSEDDRLACRDVVSRVAGAGAVPILDGPKSPEEWIRIYSDKDLVVATRAHSAVFAMCAGTPLVVISYGPKGIGIMEGAGLEHLTIGIDVVTEEALWEKVTLILNEYVAVESAIRDAVRDHQEELRGQADALIPNLGPREVVETALDSPGARDDSLLRRAMP